MAAEQNKDTGAITPTATGGASTAIKPHHGPKGPSVKEHVTQAIDYVKKNTPRGTGLLLGLALAGVLIFLLFRYFWLSSAATASSRWLRLDQAMFLSEMESVAADDALKGTEPGRLAKFVEARMRLDRGLKNLGSLTRDQALKDLEAARQLYEELAKSSGRVLLLHQEALWGAAKANESLGNIDAAKSHYEKVASTYPASALGKDAKKQLERLASPGTRKDLDAIGKALGLTGGAN